MNYANAFQQLSNIGTTSQLQLLADHEQVSAYRNRSPLNKMDKGYKPVVEIYKVKKQ